MFDAQGNLRDWWNTQTSANFVSRSQCLVDQYSAVEIPDAEGLHVSNGFSKIPDFENSVT